MEVDIIQHNGKSASPVASTSRWTLDRESDHQESQSRQGPTLSAVSMPDECPTRQASRNPVPSPNHDADELYIVRRAEIAVAPSELSALARWKKATKLQRPHTTRRNRSNSTAMNASASRQPTGHHPPLALQALPSWSSPCLLADDATTAARCSTRNRRRVSRLMNPKVKTPRARELSEPDDEIGTTPTLLRAVTFDDDELEDEPDPLDPEVPRAVPPQPDGPHNLPVGPPEQINPTVTFDEDEDELDNACEPGDPLDPEVPRAVPPQPGPHNLPAGPPEQIKSFSRNNDELDLHQTVTFDEDEDEPDNACEPGDPPDPERREQNHPNLVPITSQQDLQNKSMHTYLHLLPATRHLLPTTASPKPEGHNKITMSTSATKSRPPSLRGFLRPQVLQHYPLLRPSPYVGPPSILITNEYIDAQTTGETQSTDDKCTHTCRIPCTWRKTPQHTYDQLIRATATLLILWSQFWKWRRIRTDSFGYVGRPTKDLMNTQHNRHAVLAEKKTHTTSSGMAKKRAKLLKKKADKPSGTRIYYPCSIVLPDERVNKPFRHELPDAPTSAHALHFPPMGVFLRMRSF